MNDGHFRLRAALLQTGVAVIVVASLYYAPVARTAAFRRSTALTLDTLGNLHAALDKLSTPNAGEHDVLPQAVLLMLWMLREHDVSRYRYSEGISASPLLLQRLVEGAWPKRPDPDSRFRLSWWTESSEAGACQLLDSLPLAEPYTGVRLDHCP